MREKIPNVLEVYVDAPLSVCENRDPKGLYTKARSGEIRSFTGVTAPFEEPYSPDITCHTHIESILESTNKILARLFPEQSSGAEHSGVSRKTRRRECRFLFLSTTHRWMERST